MRAALKANPSLLRTIGAWAQSCLGTGAGYVALLLLAYHYLHSPWAIAAVLLADFLPAIAFGSWFGLCADRYPRGRLVVGANLLQAGAFAGLAFAHTAAPIVTLALAAGTGNAMLRPALRSALPGIAGGATQVAAAMYETCRYVGMTLGPLLAAGLFALSGVTIPLALNALSFVVAAGVMATVAIEPAVRAGPEDPAAGAELRAGLAIAISTPGIVAVIACSAGSIIAGGLLNVSEPILATRVLHGTSSDYALLVAVYGSGMVTASVLVARRGTVAARLLVGRYLAALALTAVGMAASAAVGSVVPAMAAFAATGYANGLLLVSEMQLIQLWVDNSVQGRLFGAKDTIEATCFLVSLVAAGVLISVAGVRATLGVGAVICGVCAAAGVGLLSRVMRARIPADRASGYAASGRSSSTPVSATVDIASAVGAETTLTRT